MLAGSPAGNPYTANVDASPPLLKDQLGVTVAIGVLTNGVVLFCLKSVSMSDPSLHAVITVTGSHPVAFVTESNFEFSGRIEVMNALRASAVQNNFASALKTERIGLTSGISR